jgi:hypothetical protein
MPSTTRACFVTAHKRLRIRHGRVVISISLSEKIEVYSKRDNAGYQKCKADSKKAASKSGCLSQFLPQDGCQD